jgi:molybdopterin-guanine dinucleotide biosynthesis protein MobB
MPDELPVMGFCAFSGTGKTTLLTRLVPLLRAKGLKLAVVKHAHHSFDLDQPGKDSYELRKAGACQMVVTSRRRTAIIHEHGDDNPEPRLVDALAAVDPKGMDLVLVEGFKHERFPKIELHRPSLGHPLLCADSEAVIAVASDRPLTLPRALPRLDLDSPEEIADFIMDWHRTAVPGEWVE